MFVFSHIKTTTIIITTSKTSDTKLALSRDKKQTKFVC